MKQPASNDRERSIEPLENVLQMLEDVVEFAYTHGYHEHGFPLVKEVRKHFAEAPTSSPVGAPARMRKEFWDAVDALVNNPARWHTKECFDNKLEFCECDFVPLRDEINAIVQHALAHGRRLATTEACEELQAFARYHANKQEAEKDNKPWPWTFETWRNADHTPRATPTTGAE